MSIRKETTVVCPKCGKDIEIEIYDSFNTQIEGIEKTEQLLSGKLFHHVCSGCGQDINMVFPFLYHDMERRFMAWVVPYGWKEEKKQIEEIQSGEVAENTPDGYITRIVGDYIDLREKIQIIDRNLDDHVIEVCKHLLWGDFCEADPEYVDYEMCSATYDYIGRDGYKDAILFCYEYDGKRDSVALGLTKEYYESIRSAMQPIIDRSPNQKYEIVDYDYGYDVIIEYKKEKGIR